MASIETAKKIIKAGRLANIGIWLWGSHGVGKSEAVAQVANEEGINFIDIRSALTEAGDWMGLPVEAVNDKGQKYAQFLMSSFLPQDPNWQGIIFLDELNRARTDVLNCVFQLVLNRCIMNHYTLPKGASIVVATNPSDDDYDVTNIDPALLGRFCHVSLTPSVDEWVKFSNTTGLRKDIVGFIVHQPKMLETKNSGLDLEIIKPSRRGWSMLGRMIEALDALKITNECLLDVATGLVGATGAVQFEEYRRSSYAKIDATKILNDYDSIRKIVLKMVEEARIPEQKQAVEELLDKKTFKEKEVVGSEKQFKNLLTFLTDIAEDVSYVGATKIVENHTALVDAILNTTTNKDHKCNELAKKLYNSLMNLDKIEQGKDKDTKKAKKGK
jgi:MoxR-like ATPase